MNDTYTPRCNGAAWGFGCPRRNDCALHAAAKAVPEAQQPKSWSIHDARAGWLLLHCSGAPDGDFPNFEPVEAAAPERVHETAPAGQLDLW